MTDHQPVRDSGNFEIGIAELDWQHRKLDELLRQLKSTTEKRYGYAVNVILRELEIETRIHFAVEESLMRLLSFPEADAHVAEHRHLTRQLSGFCQRAQDFEVSAQLSDFIRVWLLDHIDSFDRKFVAHFLGKGVDPGAMPKPD